MIEIATLLTESKELVETVPIPLMMVIVPGFIVALATAATAIATFIEAQLPGEPGH